MLFSISMVVYQINNNGTNNSNFYKHMSELIKQLHTVFLSGCGTSKRVFLCVLGVNLVTTNFANHDFVRIGIQIKK